MLSSLSGHCECFVWTALGLCGMNWRKPCMEPGLSSLQKIVMVSGPLYQRHLECCCFMSAWCSGSSFVLAETTAVLPYVVEARILDMMLKCQALKTAVLRANILIHILLLRSVCTFVPSCTMFHPRRKKYIPEWQPVIPLQKSKTFCVDQLMFYIEGSETYSPSKECSMHGFYCWTFNPVVCFPTLSALYTSPSISSSHSSPSLKRKKILTSSSSSSPSFLPLLCVVCVI